MAAAPALAIAPGDLNDDGAWDTADALLLERHLQGEAPLGAAPLAAADVGPLGAPGASHGDGLVDAGDLTVLLRLLANDDVDGDGLSAAFEVAHGFSPFAGDEDGSGTLDGLDDVDADGLVNRDEERHALDPHDDDSDGDGILDALEFAPAPSAAVATNAASSTQFLFDAAVTGNTPIQTGAQVEAIDAETLAVLRGRVRDRAGAPVSGVRVRVLGHPEYGESRTRTDGAFDLAVAGGGTLTVTYESPGHLAVQRTVKVPWQDYLVVPEVVLIPLDTAYTDVDLDGGPAIQVAQGSVSTDASGSRRPTLIFRQDTVATVTLPDDTTTALTDLRVRATEYTVGSTGPAAMPGELPPQSAYTYAVEFTVDQARELDAKRVSFTLPGAGEPIESHPVSAYLENFLGLPVGTPVPNGYYDHDKGAWLPEKSGLVVKVVSVTSGRAELDVTNDGQPDSTLSLGISDDERAVLAGLYAVGDVLWWVPLRHFSDFNLAPALPETAEVPPPPAPNGETPAGPCELPQSSTIVCESQVLLESVPVADTPFQLAYASDRTPGYTAAYTLRFPLRGVGPLAPEVEAVALDVTIAGRQYAFTYTPAQVNAAPEQEIAWDGTDVYGRPLQGRQPVTAVLRYDYAFRTTEIVWDRDAAVAWNGGSPGLRRTESPAGRVREEALDLRGRLVGSRLGTLHPARMAYDARGRIATVTHGPGGAGDRTTSFAYHPTTGRLLSITDPAGRVTSFDLYDPAGRLEQMTLPGNRVVAFDHDANGNLTSLAPPGRPAHVFRYTAVDLEREYEPPAVSGITDPRTLSDYSLDRELEVVTRPDAQQIDPAYEATTGRLDTVTIAEGVYDHGYEPVNAQGHGGRLATLSAPGGVTLAYGWDGELPISTTWSGAVAGSVTRSFDDDFRVATESVNGGQTMTYLYDADSLVDLVDQAGGPDLDLVRDPALGFGAGLLTGTVQGVVATSELPSAFGELATLTATQHASPLYALDVSDRDALGRIETKAETIGGAPKSIAYTYDPAGRLDTVTVDGTLVADYAYDLNGNRTKEREDLGGPPIAVYDDQDRLLSYAGTTYTYSEAGDLETRTDSSGTTTFGSDALGNLRTVELPSGQRIEYVIDGQNRRVGKKACAPAPCTPQLVQGFQYGDQLRIVAELDGANQVVSRFVYASRPNVPDFLGKGGTTYRILGDQVGSVRLVVNATTGAIAQRIDYDAFGVVTLDTNPGFQPFGFAGGLADRDTGLVRFGARDYEPRIGRWTSKDPIDFDGLSWNLFTYAEGDPVNEIDPSGLQVQGDDSITARAKSLAARGRLKELREYMGGRPDDFPPAKAQKLAKQCKNALERKANEAQRLFRENDEFSDFVHREFKKEIRNKGPQRNPNMSAEDWLDALEEFSRL